MDNRDQFGRLHRDHQAPLLTAARVQRKAVSMPAWASTGQVQARGDLHGENTVAIAERGVASASSPLPHLDAIQRSFGNHDVSDVRAQIGGEAADASRAIGAEAYATGNRVAFSKSPDLHTAAHEAAHVVQQRAGVQLKGRVGEAGDPYERHADVVAARVVRGESATDLLGQQGVAPDVQHGLAQKAACTECGGAPVGVGDCPACKAKSSLDRQESAPSKPMAAATVQRSECDPSTTSCALDSSNAWASSTSSDLSNRSRQETKSSEPNMSSGNAPLIASAGNEASARRYPNQTCANEVLDKLQAAMHAICDGQQSSCNPKKISLKKLDRLSCDEVAKRIALNKACLEARWLIQNTCFNGVPDEDHRIKIEETEKSIQHCENLLQRCRERERERRTLPTPERVRQVLMILGLSAGLVVLVIAALADPEPASKLAFAVGSAAVALLILQQLGIEPEEGFEA